MKAWTNSDTSMQAYLQDGLALHDLNTGVRHVFEPAQAVDLARAILQKWGTGAEREKEEKVLQHARAQNLGGRWKP